MQALVLADVVERAEFAGLSALVQSLASRITHLESRMQITEQQAADLTREVSETSAALTALSDAFVNVKNQLVEAQSELARLGVPSPAVDAAIAGLNDEQAKVAALLTSGSGGGDGPVVA